MPATMARWRQNRLLGRVFGKHSTDPIFVDLNAEGVSDLLGNPQVAETRIPPLHLDDGRDEFRGRRSSRQCC